MQNNNLEVVVIYPDSEPSQKQNQQPKLFEAKHSSSNLVGLQKESEKPSNNPVEVNPDQQIFKQKAKPSLQQHVNPYLPQEQRKLEQQVYTVGNINEGDKPKQETKVEQLQNEAVLGTNQQQNYNIVVEKGKEIEQPVVRNQQQIIEPDQRRQKKKVNLVFDIASSEKQQHNIMVEEIKSERIQLMDQVNQEEEEDSEPASQLPVATQEDSQKGNRIIGIIILCIIGGVFWIYGWASEYHVVSSDSLPVNTTTQPLYAGLLILTAIFTVIGFGLLLMYFKKTSESAIFSSLFIVSFTIIISPIFHKYWYNVLITDFSGTIIKNNDTHYLLNQSMGGTNILLDLYNIKFSLITSISQLVVLLALLNKLSPIQLVAFSFLYNFTWSLNHYLLFNIQNKSPELRLFDDYSISSVYLFAAGFGFVTMLLLKKPNSDDNQIQSSEQSAIFAHIGSFFLFITFCATTILYPQKTLSRTLQRNVVSAEAFINCFFALSASVLFSYAFSIIFNSKINVRDSVFGVVGGGIIYGCVAGFVTNIGAAIACGLGAGFFSAFFYRFVYPKLNRKRIIDTYGILSIFFISIIGTVLIPPIAIRIYQKYSVVLTTFQVNSTSSGGVVASKQAAGFSLVYPAISIGIGCGTGLMIALLLKLLDKLDADKVLNDKMYFLSSHGLRPTKQIEKRQKIKPSELKKSILNVQKKSNDKNITKSYATNEMLNSHQALQISIHLKQGSNRSKEMRKDLSSQ